MASVASQLIEEVTVQAQSDSLEDAREICADGTCFPNNLRMSIFDREWIRVPVWRDGAHSMVEPFTHSRRCGLAILCTNQCQRQTPQFNQCLRKLWTLQHVFTCAISGFQRGAVEAFTASRMLRGVDIRDTVKTSCFTGQPWKCPDTLTANVSCVAYCTFEYNEELCWLRHLQYN